MPRTLFAVLIATFALALGAAPAQPPRERGDEGGARGAAPAPGGSDLTRQLDEAVLRAGLGQFWGGVLVVRNGEVLLAKGYGFATDALDPVTPDHLFDIASASKMFTAAAILKLEEQGKLSTSDPVTKFFPDAAGAAPARRNVEPGTTIPAVAAPITIDHLLTHTSGKSDESGAIQPLNFANRDEAVRLFMKSTQASPPGERFAYCNGGYVVLAAIIERASGMPFERAMRELVLDPAGMNRSGYLDGAGLDPAKQTTRVTSMGGAGRGGRPRRALMLEKSLEPWAWGLRGAGGLCTSLNDLANWERAIRTNAVLGEAATAKWFAVDPGSSSNYARGWMVTSAGSRVKQHHGGSTRGYMCEFARFPEEGVFITVLTGETGGRTLYPGWLVDDLAKIALPALPPAAAANGDGADAAAGAARLDFSKETLTEFHSVVFEKGVRVAVERNGGAVAITASHPSPQRTLAVAPLTPAAATRLAAEIDSNLKAPGHRRGAGGAGGGGIQFGMFAYQYQDALAAAEKTVTIERGTWGVLPNYRGQDADGKAINDARIVLILTDPDKPGAWPIMIHADDAEAKRIAGELRQAAEK